MLGKVKTMEIIPILRIKDEREREGEKKREEWRERDGERGGEHEKEGKREEKIGQEKEESGTHKISEVHISCFTLNIFFFFLWETSSLAFYFLCFHLRRERGGNST